MKLLINSIGQKATVGKINYYLEKAVPRFKMSSPWRTWVTQSVEWSRHDLVVSDFRPHVGLAAVSTELT